MTIKITTIVGEVTEIVEFDKFEDYAAWVGLKMFLSLTPEEQSKDKLEDMVSLTEAKKKGSVH